MHQRRVSRGDRTVILAVALGAVAVAGLEQPAVHLTQAAVMHQHEVKPPPIHRPAKQACGAPRSCQIATGNADGTRPRHRVAHLDRHVEFAAGAEALVVHVPLRRSTAPLPSVQLAATAMPAGKVVGRRFMAATPVVMHVPVACERQRWRRATQVHNRAAAPRTCWARWRSRARGSCWPGPCCQRAGWRAPATCPTPRQAAHKHKRALLDVQLDCAAESAWRGLSCRHLAGDAVGVRHSRYHNECKRALKTRPP